MRIILLIFLFFGISFAQHTNDYLNGTGVFAASTGYTLSGTANITGGYLTITGNSGTGNICDRTITAYAIGDTFVLQYDVLLNASTGTADQKIYWQGYMYYPDVFYLPDAKLTQGETEYVVTAARANQTIFRFRSNSLWTGGEIRFDNMTFRKRITTLYIFTTGSATDNDTTNTFSDAFESRKIHANGSFVVGPGTYDESITINTGFSSSFNLLSATESAIVTSIDFNNVTGTVDLANLTITTKLNDSNITYLNEPTTETQDKGFKERNKRIQKIERIH